MEWVLLFICLAAILGAVSHLNEQAATAQKKQEREAKAAEEAAQKLQLENKLADWMLARQAEGWAYISRGRWMHSAGQPECTMSLSGSAPLLRFDKFEIGSDLTFEDPIYLNLNQIISLTVARPTVTKSRKETVPVTIVESANKSPVARGLIGGAILGPAGLVLGAASGLNAKTSTTVSHETVYRSYETKGAPQLIIGTRSDDHPVLKIRCADQEVADEWLFRIRGRMA